MEGRKEICFIPSYKYVSKWRGEKRYLYAYLLYTFQKEIS
jgi:hypothetical protein